MFEIESGVETSNVVDFPWKGTSREERLQRNANNMQVLQKQGKVAHLNIATKEKIEAIILEVSQVLRTKLQEIGLVPQKGEDFLKDNALVLFAMRSMGLRMATAPYVLQKFADTIFVVSEDDEESITVELHPNMFKTTKQTETK